MTLASPTPHLTYLPNSASAEFIETTVGPMTVTYDASVRAGYAHVRPDVAVARTIEFRDDVMIDVGDDGQIVGVETLDGPLSVGVLLSVIASCTYSPAADH